MSESNNLIQQYQDSRKGQKDYRLTNTISVAADLIIKLVAGDYEPHQTDGVWEMVEALIRQYADGRQNAQSK